MLLLLPLVVVLVIVGAMAALRLAGGDDRGGRRSRLGGLVGVVGGALGLVVLVTLIGGVVGLPGRGGSAGNDDPGGRTSEPPPSATRRSFEVPPLPVVTIAADDPDQLADDRVVDLLAPGGVVRIQASGFDSFQTGTVEQCVTERDQPPRCTNRFPVQFDDGGAAVFQYRILDGFAAGRCRTDTATCHLAVRGRASSHLGRVQTVFVDAYRAARVRVRPDRGLEVGQLIDVAVAGLAPGADAEVVFCAPPGRYDPSRCQADGARLAVGIDGTGSARVAVAAGRVGIEGPSCATQRGCSVIVLSDNGFVSAPGVPVRYSLGPGPRYEAGRLVEGMAVALALVGVALVLVRTTDWAKPTEAATPEMDDADLETGASLDELFGTDAALEALDPLSI